MSNFEAFEDSKGSLARGSSLQVSMRLVVPSVLFSALAIFCDIAIHIFGLFDGIRDSSSGDRSRIIFAFFLIKLIVVTKFFSPKG